MKGLLLTQKGKKVLGINDGKSNRHGGPEHRYWVKRIADHLRSQRYAVTEEVPIGNGKTIDLLATKGGQTIAFEIETGKSDAVANVRKCLALGLDKVVVAATSAVVRDRLSTISPGREHVELLTATEVLHRRW